MAKRRKVNEDVNEGAQGDRPKIQASLSLFEELKQVEAIDM